MLRLMICLIATLMMASAFAQDDTMIGEWSYFNWIDPITDENRSSIVAMAHEYPQYVSLSGVAIQCRTGQFGGVSVLFLPGRLVWEDTSVVYRIDSREPVNRRWFVATNNEVLIVTDYLTFIDQLLDSNVLVVRLQTRDGSLTYQVRTSGLREALAHLGCFQRD